MKIRFTAFALLAIVVSPAAIRADPPATDGLAAPLSLSPYEPLYAGDTPTTSASPPPFLDNTWHLSVAVPLWIPGIDGDLFIRGREVQPDLSSGDTIDVLKARLNFAISARAEVRKNRLALFGEGMYVDLRVEGPAEDRDAEASFRAFIGETGLAYTLVAPENTGFGAFRLDAIGGVRVAGIRLGFDGERFGGSANKTLYDPFVGVRGELGLADWLSLKARADVGGFGISSWPASDVSYNIEAGLDFKISKSFDVTVGYRWLKYEFVRDPAYAEFNATLGGPFLSLQVNF